MQHFVSRLNTHQGYLNFYFNLIYTADDERYHVSTVTRERKTLIFHLVKDRLRWKLAEPETYPNWIVVMEQEFSDEIRKHKKHK